MSDDQLPTSLERKLWMGAMLLGGAVLAGVGWAAAFLPCAGSPDISACGLQPTDLFYSYCCAVQKNPPWILISGVAAAPALVLTWWWRTQQKDTDIAHKEADIALAKRGERSERFLEAVKLLWSDSAAVRLGGVYSLESLARESHADLPRILDTLCAFVRLSKGKRGPAAADIAGAFTVLCRIHRAIRENTHMLAEEIRYQQILRIDLSGATLNGARVFLPALAGAELGAASFIESRLYGGSLSGAQMQRAKLSRAMCQTTNFEKADLTDADCSGADFTLSSFKGCRLKGCNLTGSNLRHCDLRGADLSGALLDGAILEKAKYDSGTQLPTGFDVSGRQMDFVDGDSSKAGGYL